MAYAIFKTGGKQYRVSEGDRILVEKLPEASEGDSFAFGEVLLMNDGNSVLIGNPLVEGAQVGAKVLAQKRAKKVTCFKYKRRKGYHKTKGHRRHVTELEIESISS